MYVKRITYSILILVFLGIIFYFLVIEKKQATENNLEGISAKEYVSYKNSEYGPEFTYPKNWGEVILKEGNKTCPEEDTYRTSDTLHTYEWEFSFNDINLPNSDSFIRTGIRLHELDPKNLNDCGDDFLLQIAQGKVIPETISSFKLDSITNQNGLSGIYNSEASRLNTEARIQYTFFIQGTSVIYVIQPYTSFIPYFGSPELTEMEKDFNGDMARYIREGITAENIRSHLEEFKKMANNLKFRGE